MSLEVADFRNYRHAHVDFGPGCCVLVGLNGQGKTNLVEAVGYAATLGSHRVATDAPLVRSDAETAVIRVIVQRGQRRARLELAVAPGRGTRARLNGSPLPRTRDCLGLLRVVTFAPEDLALVKGDPAERRRFLDDLLIQRQPRWAGVISDFDRVLRQRGALLRGVAKRGGRPDETDRSTLDVWDGQLADLGGQLWWARQDLLTALAPFFQHSYRVLAGGDDTTELQYRSSSMEPQTSQPSDLEQLQQFLSDALARRHDEEFRRGVNLTGPQRDDVAILLHGHPAKGFASHGESWSLALALRLASYQLLSQEAVDDGDPVLILDDVFAELDASRRQRLADAVASAEQVLITAAVAEDVPPALAGARYRVQAGSIEREFVATP